MHVSEHPESFCGTLPATEPAPADHALAPVGDPQACVMNQIRKWRYHFDGKNPVSFLERIEELKEGYQISGAQLLLGLPELLGGDALFWHCNNRLEWRTWERFIEYFRDYYLPPRYRAQLHRDIRARLQTLDEPYRKFATDLLTMMRPPNYRRRTGWTFCTNKYILGINFTIEFALSNYC